MTKMFKSVTDTWNLVSGCLHSCKYCYARIMANGRLKPLYLSNRNIAIPVFKPYEITYGHEEAAGYDPYLDPFYPRFWPERLKRRFKPGILVFVVDMGDLFGEWVPTEWILAAIDYIKKFPYTDFLFLTKNSERYMDFDFPDNAILGTTLETNRATWNWSWAGPPSVRQHALAANPHPRKFVSIEPIMDFNLEVLFDFITGIKPELVEVGADNYHNNLPEPPESKLRALLEKLRGICPKVVEKDGLRRLLK